jgi:hypothetical protein
MAVANVRRRGMGSPEPSLKVSTTIGCSREEPDRPISYERIFRGSIAWSAEGMGGRVS